MNIAAGNTATTCDSASADDVSIVMPNSGTLTGLAVLLNSNLGSGKIETFTVRNLTTAVDTGLTVTVSREARSAAPQRAPATAASAPETGWRSG